jgi:hypothetical protein
MFHKRVTQHPFMQAFDEPDSAVSCARRNTTTVAPQALALLNDTFLRDRAADFAQRLIAFGDHSEDNLIDRGFWLALSHPPTETEREASLQFIDSQRKHRAARDHSLPAEEVHHQAVTDFCQALFSLNEFIYVD